MRRSTSAHVAASMRRLCVQTRLVGTEAAFRGQAFGILR
ncbi:hypothetical protein SAMN05443668_12066 [Cryptosporangium aurantiacum]|uniref:Uncharacterized protein n=1 Tax=Cryptosporangium aurantiacum TaxID=134849 RepID=A0A1M7RLQ9_9ACTN|nr:hypothetical protein SAMN05443668_12066 [Cryptosporangium aurantiacum]